MTRILDVLPALCGADARTVRRARSYHGQPAEPVARVARAVSPRLPAVLAFGLVLAAAPALAAQLTMANPLHAPPARDGQHAFFDEPRGRVTVFGGNAAGTYSDAAWAFDGSCVIPCANGTGLGARAYGGIATDPGFPGRAIVFGGRAQDGMLYGDTLRWDDTQATFVRLTPAASPPARWLTAMAHDTARGRVVLFGGGDVGGWRRDTWEWDGATWVQRVPAVAPPARSNHCIAYDAARGVTVLFGGYGGGSRNDTWTWDGSQWTQRTPASSPPRRHNHALAYDARRQVVVLFGGKDDAGNVLDDLWEWNGTTWQQPPTNVRPPARELASLVFDPLRQGVTLCGGSRNGAAFGDVWFWGGTAWVNPAPKPSVVASAPPPRRTGHACAFDARRNRMVVFGGSDGARVYGDLWEYDFMRWLPRSPGNVPPPRSWAGMAYDPSAERCYLIGGFDGRTDVDTALWAWDGVQWTVEHPAVIPPRHAHACVFDSVRNKLVVFGGYDAASGAELGDLWEYERGRGWKRLPLPNGPSARASCAAAFHPLRGSVMFYGGLARGRYLGEMWELENGTRWRQHTGLNMTPLADAAMVHDGNWLLLFGGRNQDGLHFLHAFDPVHGLVATGPHRGTPPSPRVNATVVRDERTNRLVVFGGMDALGVCNDVYDCDVDPAWPLGILVSWTPRAVDPSRGRAWHCATYDPARGETVVFGGGDLQQGDPGRRIMAPNHLLNDTTTWDGTRWTAKDVAVPPPARQQASMAYEARSQAVVLFGGSANRLLDDSWAWDGRNWKQLSISGPSARVRSAMVGLWPRNGVVLFGGGDGATAFGDTWRYDGRGAWQQVSSAGPAARAGHAMAYDSVRNRVVLFGGQVAGTAAGDTWEFDVATNSWQQLSPTTTPPARMGHVLAFDAARGRTVLMDGHDGRTWSPHRDMWEWNGVDWLRRSVVDSRTPQLLPLLHPEGHAMSYDANRARCVLTGGFRDWVWGAIFATNDVTELWAPIDGAGRGMHQNPQPLLSLSQPVIGSSWKLWFDNPSGSGVLRYAYGTVQGPLATLPAPPYCGTGGSWYVPAGGITLPYGNHAPGSFALTIPYDTAMVGRTMVLQGVSMQASCAAVTDALHAVFQRP